MQSVRSIATTLSRVIVALLFLFVGASGLFNKVMAESHMTVAPGNPVLVSGGNTLTFPSRSDGTYGLLLHSSDPGTLDALDERPAAIYVCQGVLSQKSETGSCLAADQNSDPAAANTFLAGYYSVVEDSEAEITAHANISSTSGTVYSVVDIYHTGVHGMMSVARTVTVTKIGIASTPEIGFNSQFSLSFAGPSTPMFGYHFLAPSVLYDQNATAPVGAFATDLADATTKWSYWRETHSALPMILIQDEATGSALSLARTGPLYGDELVASSGIDENNPDWIVDVSSQYASLGIQKISQLGQANPTPAIGVVYPSFEADINYIGGSPYRWVRRSDPVIRGASQTYCLSFDLKRYARPSGGASFAEAAGATTRAYYDRLDPPIGPDNSEQMFSAVISLNKHLFATLGNGDGRTYPGVPFAASADGARTPNYDYRFGFTGGQPSIGFQMLTEIVAS